MPHLARSLSPMHWPAAARRWLRRCAVLLALGAAGASLLLGPMATASSPGALGASPETAAPLAVGAPQFFVEHLGSNFPCNPQEPSLDLHCERYRITARSQPAEGRAVVILQSIYAAQ